MSLIAREYAKQGWADHLESNLPRYYFTVLNRLIGIGVAEYYAHILDIGIKRKLFKSSQFPPELTKAMHHLENVNIDHQEAIKYHFKTLMQITECLVNGPSCTASRPLNMAINTVFDYELRNEGISVHPGDILLTNMNGPGFLPGYSHAGLVTGLFFTSNNSKLVIETTEMYSEGLLGNALVRTGRGKEKVGFLRWKGSKAIPAAVTILCQLLKASPNIQYTMAPGYLLDMVSPLRQCVAKSRPSRTRKIKKALHAWIQSYMSGANVKVVCSSFVALIYNIVLDLLNPEFFTHNAHLDPQGCLPNSLRDLATKFPELWSIHESVGWERHSRYTSSHESVSLQQIVRNSTITHTQF